MKDHNGYAMYTSEIQAGVERAQAAADRKVLRWGQGSGDEHRYEDDTRALNDPCDPKVTGPEFYDPTINGTTAGDQLTPPAHYPTVPQPIDLIDAGEAAGMIGYYEGQIIKYVFRWRRKNGLRDLKAAAWFLNRMITREEARVPSP